MYRLTAKYEVELPRSIRVRRADDDELCYCSTIDGFDVEVSLVRNGGARSQFACDVHDTLKVDRIVVSVSREEDTAPPEIHVADDGSRDFTKRAPYFSGISPQYRAVAAEAVNRIIRFCRYELSVPNIHEFYVGDSRFMNPKWIADDQPPLAPGVLEFSVTVISSRGPGSGMQEDWHQSAHLLGEKPCVLHLCKDTLGKWSAYITHGWKNGPFHPSPDHPAIADNVSIAKRLAGLIGAPVCFLVWKMRDKRVGDFTGEVIMCKEGGQGGEEGCLLRCYVTDSSFRIAWYADEVEAILSQRLASGAIRPLPGYVSRGRNTLKDHMGISLEVPEAQTVVHEIWKGLDAYGFCE